jgi:hypothetical protein
MNIQTLFEIERARYVSDLLNVRSKTEAEFPGCVSELLLSINNEAIPYPYRYLRVDLLHPVLDGNPQPCEVRVGLDPAFKTKQFDFGSFVVEVRPFTWNSVHVLFDRPVADGKLLDSWITDLLDIESKNVDSKCGLSLAVHSFTQLSRDGDWWHLTGDFGTAPPETLVQFVELLASQGVTRIVIAGGDATT